MNDKYIKEHERADDLQINGLHVIQNPDLFCFGTDAVLLANFAAAKKDEKVLDIGTGTGVIPILMSAKTKAKHFTGLEIQPEMADMARRSVALNKLENRITIDNGDIKKAAEMYGFAAFDVITVNPPYLNAGEINKNPSVAIARHEIACTLEDIAEASAKLLRFGGRLYMIHRPHRLADIICTMRNAGIEPKKLKIVRDELILLEGTLGGKVWMKIERSETT
jgi:tRNA1Val (adenine37-N6)-methyltransferase